MLSMRELESLVGGQIRVGFGRNNQRVVIESNGKGITFYAGKDRIQMCEKEKIKVMITPSISVYCRESDFSNSLRYIVGFRKHGFISILYNGKGDLIVSTMPDHTNAEGDRSEFFDILSGLANNPYKKVMEKTC